MWLVVNRYIDILTMIINFPYSTCINSFFGSCKNKNKNKKRPKKHLKMNKEVGMLLLKKELIQVE